MNLAVLRAEGVAEDLTELEFALKRATIGEYETEPLHSRRDGTRASGFNLCISDASSRDAMISEIRHFLRACKDRAVPFKSLCLTTVLDIGITVGTPEQFTASVSFSPEDLALLAEVGLAVCVSAYPASSDDEVYA